jgi:hypothetical protein
LRAWVPFYRRDRKRRRERQAVQGDDQIFALESEANEILCGPGDNVARYDPAPASGESSDTFLDGSCEATDDTVD